MGGGYGVVNMLIDDIVFNTKDYENEDIVGYWSFNEGSGSTAYDSSGNDNNGTIYGAERTVGGGISRSALNFDGIDDYVEIADDDSLDFGPDGDLTVGAWIKTSSVGNVRLIADKREVAEIGYSIGLTSYGNIGQQISDGINCIHVNSNSLVNNNKWHYVVFTVKRNGNLKVYVDGAFENQSNVSIVGDISNNNPLNIGQRYTGDHNFNGTIDEVRIYNRSLNSSEISDYYNQTWQSYLQNSSYHSKYVINWDDFTYGSTSGSGDFYNWARTSGDDFYIYDGFVNSSPKSLYLDAGTQAFYDDPDFGEINVELPYKLTNITMDIKHILFQSSGEDGVLNVYRFYNGTHLMGQLGMKTWMFSSRYGYYPGMVQYEHGAYYFNETTSQWVFFKSWGFTSNEDINVLIEPSVAEDKIRFAVQHQGGAWGYSDYSIFDNPGDKWGGITKITISQVIDDYGGGLWRC